MNLEIWRRSHKLTLATYKITLNFPKSELFGLISQMQRSSASVPTNIAEGCGRETNPQLKHFLKIASRSLSELQYQYILSKDLNYVSEAVFVKANLEIMELRKMIFSYSKHLV